MKSFNTLFIILCMLFSSPVEAQFLKKLKKRAAKAAEEKVLQKAEQKATKETEKSFDKVFNMNIGGTSSVDPSSLPSQYEFEWRYTLEMSARKRDFKMHYFLKEDGGTFASKPEMEGQEAGNMLMVFDPSSKALVMLMESGDKKFGQIIDLPETPENMAEKASDMEGYTMTELGQKEILGYTCQGFKMENEEHLIISYVALDAPVSFGQMGQAGPQTLPKGLDPKWLKYAENSILMEMQFTHKKKKKQSMTMRCIALEKEPKNINVSEYEFMQMTSKQN